MSEAFGDIWNIRLRVTEDWRARTADYDREVNIGKMAHFWTMIKKILK